MKRYYWPLACLGFFVVGSVAGYNGHSPKTVTTATPPAPPPSVLYITEHATDTVTVTVPAAPTTPSGSIPGDGTYIVGTDIKPGLYKTAGPEAGSLSGNCYWERDKDLSGELGSIAQNDNTTGPTTVQIFASDRAFKTDGCSEWIKVG